mgnify:FL=1
MYVSSASHESAMSGRGGREERTFGRDDVVSPREDERGAESEDRRERRVRHFLRNEAPGEDCQNACASKISLASIRTAP